MELNFLEKEMVRAGKALASESYGSDEAGAILNQMTKLADMYKTISETDANRTRIDDAHDKDVKELEIRESENKARNELETKRLELERDKASLEKEKLISTNEADKNRLALDEKKLKLDELKADAELQETVANRAQRNREMIFGISKDMLLSGLQIGVGIASSIVGLKFGQQILKFEETGAVVSWTGKNVFPKILGKLK